MPAIAALRRILCLLGLLGIVMGPVGVGTAAGAMVPLSDVMVGAPSDVAIEHPPCCPEEQTKPAEGCGTGCTRSLICSPSVLACEGKADGWRVDLSGRDMSHRLANESRLSSALVEPPSRPPKT